jgi:polysaccharide export outer membrane protein
MAPIATTLAACGAQPPVVNPYHASGWPEAAAVSSAAGVPSWAAGTSAPAGQLPAAGPAFRTPSVPSTNEDPLLGTGDLVEISVFEVEELSKIKLRIPQRGVIRLPLVGSLQASGRTVSELEDDIRQGLQKKYMHDPQVTVFVLEYKSHMISVTGAVTKGGVHPLTSRLRVSDALALAEGLAADADTTIYLVRWVPADVAAEMEATAPANDRPPRRASDGKVEVTVPIDLEALSRGKDDLNIVLQAGDVLHVPKANTFYVGGQVAKPGIYPLRQKTTIQQGIFAAGGVTEVAAWGDIRLYRVKPNGEREVIAVDLDEIEAGKQEPPELKKQDVVIVGKHYGKATFIGIRDFVRGMFSMGMGI